MRIGFFQKIVVMLRIIFVSINGSSLVIFGHFFLKNKDAYASRAVHSWAFKVLSIARVRYKILNPNSFKFEDGRPYIIMSNHLSHFDIPLIYAAFPNDVVGMVSKRELFHIPIFGWGMRFACIPIDRENKKQAIKDLANAKQAMLRGWRAWIAPEGTRSRTGKMGRFKKGGFKMALGTKATIVPVTIIGSNKVLPSKTLDISLDEEVEVHIGKPIDTSECQLKDLKQLMIDTFDTIASKMP